MISPQKLKSIRNRWLVRRKMAGLWLRLRFSGKQVRIHAFRTDSALYAADGWIFLSWQVENAWELHISGVGRVHPSGKVRLRAAEGMEQIVLTAFGPGGPVQAQATFSVRHRHPFRADGTPTARQAWPPTADFAVPSTLRPLMMPQRAIHSRRAWSEWRFLPQSSQCNGPFMHSPPESLVAQFHQGDSLAKLNAQLAQIRQAADQQTLEVIRQSITAMLIFLLPLYSLLAP